MKSPSFILLLGSLALSTFSTGAFEFENAKPFDALPTKAALPFETLDHAHIEIEPDVLFPEESSVLSPSSSSGSINIEESEVHSEELPEYSSLVKRVLRVKGALVCVFLPNDAYEEMMVSVEQASKKITWLRVPAHNYREDAKQAGLSGNTFPSAIGYRQDQPGKTYVFPEDSPFDLPHLLEWAKRTISHVCRSKPPKPSKRVPAGTLHLKKGETIVEVNAHNFDEIVFDETKDVVIELLVPELERNLQKAPTLDVIFRDVDSVVIAQADLSAKKVPLARWSRHSTLYISPIGCKSEDCLKRYTVHKHYVCDVADFVLRHSKSLSQIQKDSIQLTKLALVPWISPQLSLFIKQELPLVYVFVKGPGDGCDRCKAVYNARMNELQKAWKGLQGQVSWMYVDLKYYAHYAKSLGLSGEGIVRFSSDFKSKSVLREGTLLQANEIIDWAREPLSGKKFNDMDLQPNILLNAAFDDIRHEDEKS